MLRDGGCPDVSVTVENYLCFQLIMNVYYIMSPIDGRG